MYTCTCTCSSHRTLLYFLSTEAEVGCGRSNCKCSDAIKFAQDPSLETELPYLDTEGLSSEEAQAKRDKLMREYKEIVFSYQMLVSYTIRGIIRNNHPVKAVSDYVEGLESFYRARNSKEEPVPVFKHLLDQIREVKSVDQLFVIIREHCSFFNHHAVIEMKHALGGHHSDRRREKTFLEQFNFYARRKVIECPQLYAHPSLHNYCTMHVLVDRDPTDFSLHEVESVRLRIGIQLKVARNTLRLIYLEKSGRKRVLITFQFPAFLHSLVFPLNDEQRTNLMKEKIVYMDCCDYKFSIEVSYIVHVHVVVHVSHLSVIIYYCTCMYMYMYMHIHVHVN